FKATVEGKIQGIIAEFAEGKISREQFQVIYARYSEQLAIANAALMTGSEMSQKADNTSTIAVRSAHQGKATGLMIYYNRNGIILETLGELSVPISVIGPILNNFSFLMEENKRAERLVKKIGEKEWLLLAAGRYTTIVTQFKNEPSQLQIRELERLHKHFEDANGTLFANEKANAQNMAYPFLEFIEKRMKG
ncbi:MAG: hypothetical protein SH821_09420, partial [Phototrophicales bacterium]|nr:hypothetical protein [Phototrophicales bacterium]